MTSLVTDQVSPLPPLRRERLIDRAVEAIKSYMIANGLQAGERLPSEAELAQSLGVSRNVVRQALSSLEAVGIVRTEHGRGTFVAELGASNNVLQHLAFWLDIERLSQDDYLDARAAFEAGVLQRVMRRATADDLHRLERLVQALESADSEEAIQRQHDAFHNALLEATHNRFLAALGMILYRFFWSLAARAPHVRLVPPRQFARSHRALLAGLRARDEARIPELIADHLSGAGDAPEE